MDFSKEELEYDDLLLKTELGKYTITTAKLDFVIPDDKGEIYTYDTLIAGKHGKILDYHDGYKTKEDAIEGHKKAIIYIQELEGQVI